MVGIQLKRWTRQEFDKMIDAGVFAPGERSQLIEGEILDRVVEVYRDPTPNDGYATQRVLSAGESIQPVTATQAPIHVTDLLP